jgi:diaminopimelate decarboxylase
MPFELLQQEIAGYPVTALADKFGTPTFFYHRETIEKRIDEVKAFDVVRYAQKACSNIAILSLMRKKGVKVDAVSAGEIFRAVKAGYNTGPGNDDIVYTADIFDNDSAELIKDYGITVNIGSPDMLQQLAKFCPGSEVLLRVNPGFGHGHSQKVNTGGELSKHGVWHGSLTRVTETIKSLGLSLKGLHMHIGSGSDFDHLSKVGAAMVKAVNQTGCPIDIISAGGGLPIPYNKSTPRINLEAYFQIWDKARKSIESINGRPVRLETEPGRYLVAESGTLVTKICSVKKTGGTRFYLVDAGFNTLLRPAMYGAYHEISVARRRPVNSQSTEKVIVAGPLCESGDVFTQSEGGSIAPRELPEAGVGDYLLIHDAGAYGSAMSSNYNSKPLAAEVLLSASGADLIREKQTLESLVQFERIPKQLK